MSNYNGNDARRLVDPRRQLAEARETPPDLLLLAAGLLERHGAASSECRACAGRLRGLVRQMARASRGGEP